MAGRTIVVSDLHGYDALLENALEDAGFGAGDALVVAGDLVDIGPDDCIALAQAHGATILAGNHEVSAALGLDITPQNPETPARHAEFAARFLSGEWPLAAAVDGWLVTHGGLSTMFADDIERAGGDVERLAASLNDAFRDELRRFLGGELSAWSLGRSRIVGSELGPLWFRAATPEMVPDGLEQVVGHTPCEIFGRGKLAALQGKPFLLVDPGAHLESDPRRRFRYAVIEGGGARVVGGCLARPKALRG
jgi:hypothetical protein